jgi:hypothetical protein
MPLCVGAIAEGLPLQNTIYRLWSASPEKEEFSPLPSSPSSHAENTKFLHNSVALRHITH